MNLVKMLQEQVSSDALGTLSSELGADPERTGRAATAAVPALLAGLAKLATNDEGLRKLTSVLGGMDSTVGEFSQAIGDNSSGLLRQGTGMLSNLFGNSMLSSIASSIGRYAGIDPAIVHKLLGFIAPMVLGEVAGEWKSRGGTTSALTSFLGEQARQLPDALPAGFSLDQIPGMTAAADAMRGVSESTRRAATTAGSAGSSMASWLLPVAALLLLGFLAWNFLKPENAAVPVVADSETSAPQEVTAMRPPALDASIPTVADADEQVKAMMAQFNETLASIKDQASAEAALPKLQELNTKLESLKAAVATLPEAGRATLEKTMDTTITPLKEQAKTTLNLPGLSDRVKELINQIVSKLEDWKNMLSKA